MRTCTIVALSLLSLLLLGGCNNRAARSLGHIAPTERRDWPANADDRITLTDPTLVVTIGSEQVPLLPVYRVDGRGNPTSKSSLKYGVFLMADVTMLEKHHYLGLDPTKDTELRQLRGVIFHKLLNIAESNGDEYWRRLFGGMKYADAFEEGSNALMGAAIAGTFISPVLGASLTGAGLASDAFSEELLSGFNPDLYKEVQTAIEHEVEIETDRIRGKLAGGYSAYPATALVNDMVDLARMYSVEYGMKALEKANAARKSELKDKKLEARQQGAAEVGA